MSNNTIIARACEVLEAEIAEAQQLLAQMRAHTAGPTPRAKKKAARKNGKKKSTWSAARRAKFRKTLAAKKAEAAK